MRSLIVAVCLPFMLVGCGAVPPTIDRHAQLMTMAAAEAAEVPNPWARLKRQLNLADAQLDHDEKRDASHTLAAAADTLRGLRPDELPPLVRIAGWVSVSEQSRRAEDTSAANAACDQAVAELRSVDPATERAEYVVGVANEVRELRGKPVAAKLLVEGAAWAGEVKFPDRRRTALTEIADATFDCDDFPRGLGILHVDPDPAWRSDTLASLAERESRRPDWASNVGNASVPGSLGSGSIRGSAPASRPAPFEKAVDYQSVFGSSN